METSANRTALGVNSDIAQQVGARLRKARESIGRSTSALSAKIKVREHYLVAIEEGQWNELPPGLNGRGLIRIYARELSVSVPELDQAANQTVMPAEHDAQAPYQIGGAKRDVSVEREAANVRPAVDVHTPSASLPRVAEVPARTNTLTTPSRNLRAGDSVHAPRTSGYPNASHRAMEMTPEEEPLDVVTPDVASILGISLDMGDMQPPQQKVRPLSTAVPPAGQPEPLAVAAAVLGVEIPAPVQQPVQVSAPVQPVLEVIAPVEQVAEVSAPVQQPAQAAAPAETQMQSHQHTNQHGKKNKKHGRGRHERDSSSVQPSEYNLESSFAAGETNAVQPVQAQSSDDNQNTAPIAEAQTLSPDAAAAPETPTLENSVGLSAAESYLRSHSQDAATSESPERSEQTSGSRGFKIALGLLAACVLVLVGGRLLTQEKGVTSNSEETKSAAQETSAADGAIGSESAPPKPAEASAAAGENPAQATQANVDQGVAAPVANAQSSQTDPAAASASAPASSATDSSNSDSAGSQSSAAVLPTVATAANAASAEEAAPATSEDSAAKPLNKLNATGAAAAVLTLSEPIEIQVTADGQRIYSGRHEAGKIDIKFNKRAEIFVQDGSKAKLKYSGWEHGALGQAGRKRRIVLNADAFSSGRP